MPQDYQESYKTLNLSATAEWAEIKLAYRRQVQLWHPDRHQDSSDQEHKEASDKFLSVTSAFEHIQRYYKENGKLPPVAEKPRPQGRPAQNIDIDSLKQKSESRKKSGKKKNFSVGKLSLALLAGGLTVVAIVLVYDYRDQQEHQYRYNVDKPNLTKHKTAPEYGSVYWLENINSDIKGGSMLGTTSKSVGDTMDQRMNETGQ